ncbi:alpha/beta hydrolase [Kribbella sp. NPDC055110]
MDWSKPAGRRRTCTSPRSRRRITSSASTRAGPGSTPITGARSLARQIDSSRLLTADAYGHTAYFNSTCARDRIADYLLVGRLPTTSY